MTPELAHQMALEAWWAEDTKQIPMDDRLCGAFADILMRELTAADDERQAFLKIVEYDLCVQPPEAAAGVNDNWHVWRYRKPNFTAVKANLVEAVFECVTNYRWHQIHRLPTTETDPPRRDQTSAPQCTCGQPNNLWIVHRADGPCFQYTSMDLAAHERAEKQERLESDMKRYLIAFAHIHVNKGDGTDTCKQCGLDLRDQIHFPKWININYEYRLRGMRRDLGDEIHESPTDHERINALEERALDDYSAWLNLANDLGANDGDNCLDFIRMRVHQAIESIRLILPLAKGYAAAHPLKINDDVVAHADDFLETLRLGGERKAQLLSEAVSIDHYSGHD